MFSFHLQRLDPCVDEVVSFPLEIAPSNRTKTLTYGVKQLIAREIEVERMRREEPKHNNSAAGEKKKNKRESTSLPNNSSPSGGEAETAKKAPSAKSTSHLNQKLKAKEVDLAKAERRPVDFFGRAIAVPADGGGGGDDGGKKHLNEIVSSDVWFKFKEGYNNAVRRNVRMKDLL